MQHKLNKRTLSHQDMIQIDKTNNTLTRCMIKIENTHKADLHNSPWYSVLSNRIIHLSYWKLAVFQILTKLSHIVRLQKIAMQLSPPYDISIFTVTATDAKRRTTRKELRQKNSQNLTTTSHCKNHSTRTQ